MHAEVDRRIHVEVDRRILIHTHTNVCADACVCRRHEGACLCDSVARGLLSCVAEVLFTHTYACGGACLCDSVAGGLLSCVAEVLFTHTYAC